MFEMSDGRKHSRSPRRASFPRTVNYFSLFIYTLFLPLLASGSLTIRNYAQTIFSPSKVQITHRSKASFTANSSNGIIL